MKNHKLLFFAAPILALSLSGCNKTTKTETNSNTTIQKDLVAESRDTTVAPGDDFFMYANGGWIKNHPIPASESSWNIGKEVQNEIYAKLKKISEDAAKSNAAKGSSQQKIGDFYFSGMDTVTIEKLGLTPLQPELDKIEAIKTAEDVKHVIAQQQTYGVGSLFGMFVAPDEMNSNKMALHLYQGGLGLPNRDYYFNTDSRTLKIRKEYEKHVAKIFNLMGQDSVMAKKSAATVLKLETSLAKASRKLEALRDPYANYNKMTLASLNKLTPGTDWKTMLGQMHITSADSAIIGQPEFYKQVGAMLKTVKPDDWKLYLKWQLVNTFADKLSKNFDQANFHFYGTVMQGRTQERARWKRVLDEEEKAMGEELGKLFVSDYFSPKTKQRYEQMADNVIAAYREHIQKLDWMSDTTKQKALVKLSKISKKVGYPDKWKDFSALTIERGQYLQNVMRANAWWYNYEINKLGKPVDRTEWDMTPQTYNAYYNPSNNEIVLPAAIFAIPGLKDENADDAVIYGYAGASTIGHELTHGFDDEGSQFNEHGNLQNWWTKTDQKQFKGKVNQIVKQFNGYVVLDSMHVNGAATAGENIADLGGIVIALDAFKKTEQYKKGEKISGLTPTQRYFLGYALGWQGHQRDERLAQQILTDVHAPANLRVNGPFSDVPEFYQAFNVKPGQKLYQPDSSRVKIW